MTKQNQGRKEDLNYKGIVDQRKCKYVCTAPLSGELTDNLVDPGITRGGLIIIGQYEGERKTTREELAGEEAARRRN